MALGTVATGVVQALAGAWGLVRHYWVVFKLVLTVVATSVLLLKLGPIDDVARSAMTASFAPSQTGAARTSLLVHAAGGVVILVLAAILAVYKPRGLTRWGVKSSGAGPSRPPPWVRNATIAVIALAVIVAAMVISGAHGPGAHRH